MMTMMETMDGNTCNHTAGQNNTGNVEMKKKRQQQWLCDVCKIASFEDFDEACRHEEECQKLQFQQQQQQQQQRKQSARETKKVDDPQRRRSTSVPSNVIVSAEEENTENGTTGGEMLSQRGRITSSWSSNTPQKRDNPCNKKNQPKKKKNKKTTSEQTSHSFFAPRGVANNKQVQTDSSSCASEKMSTSGTATTTTKNSRNVTSFFAPRKKPGKSLIPTTTYSDNDSSRSSDGFENVEKTITGTTSQKDSDSSRRNDSSMVVVEKVVVAVEESSDDDNMEKYDQDHSNHNLSQPISVEEVTKSANELAASIDKAAGSSPARKTTKKTKKKEKTQLASIFGSGVDHNKLLAEQRLVEFQAKRRLQKQQEVERQQRKQQQQEVVLETNKTAKQNGTSQLLTYTKTDDERSTSSQNTKQSSSSSAVHHPWPDCRFPTPNHILPHPKDTTVSAVSISASTSEAKQHVEKMWMQNSHQRYRIEEDTTMPDGFVSESSNKMSTRPLISSPTALDADDDHLFPREDLLLEAFSKVIVPPSSGRKGDHRLFVDKYGMKQNGYVGETTQATTQKMKAWIKAWQIFRRQAMDRMAERQRKLAKKKKTRTKKKRKTDYEDDDDEYLWNGSDDEDSTLNSLCLISGPPGSGKTALVHEVAQQCKCKVLEINSTGIRGGQALKNAIQEATQSCSSMDMLKKKNQQQQHHLFLSNKNKVDPFGDSDDDGDNTNARDENTMVSLTCILIDEVDIMFESEGDAGFWAALQSLAKTAKCPIFMTAQYIPSQLLTFNQRYEHLETQRPTPAECAQVIQRVIRQEELDYVSVPSESGEHHSDVASKLEWIAKICNCDLRKLLMELQSFLHEKPNQLLSATESRLPPEFSNETKSDGSLPVPILTSLEPSQVPVDKFSIIKVKGANLHALLAAETSEPKSDDEHLERRHRIEVKIGNVQCQQFCLIDAETMLILCPPCPYRGSRPSKENRVAPVSVCSMSTSLGYVLIDGTKVQPLNVDGDVDNTLPCSSHLCVTYVSPDDDDAENQNSNEGAEEEYEWDDGSIGRRILNRQKSLEQGMKLWNETFHNLALAGNDANLFAAAAVTKRNTTREDVQMQSALEQLALDAVLSSDAAFLADLQGGVPYVSGACRGFGFDYVDCDHDSKCPTSSHNSTGKLRMHEKSRPPREERLYELGWNESSYFHGDPDCYMTMPKLAHERKRIKIHCNVFRGRESFGSDSAPNSKDKDIQEDTAHAEDYVLSRFDSTSAGEDMYLSQPIQGVIEALPRWLWKNSRPCNQEFCYNKSLVHIDEWAKMKQMQGLGRLRDLVENLFPLNDRPSMIAGDTFFPDSVEENGSQLMTGYSCPSMFRVLVLDYLPTLRSIGLLERIAENAESKSEVDQLLSSRPRRTTRRQAAARRHHYYDKLSAVLRQDRGTLSSTEIGSRMADNLLFYTGKFHV